MQAVEGFRVGDSSGARVKSFRADWDKEVERIYNLRHGPPISQGEAIGVVNSISGPKDVVVCVVGSLPGDLHKLWRKAAIPRKVEKYRMPDNLAPLIGSQPHCVHAVIENFFRDSAHLTERLFVHAQQRVQLLVQRRFGNHLSADAEREGKTPKLLLLAFHLERTQMAQFTCACLPGGVSNRRAPRFAAEVGCGRSQLVRIVYPPRSFRSRSSRRSTLAFHTPARIRSSRYGLNGSSFLACGRRGPCTDTPPGSSSSLRMVLRSDANLLRVSPPLTSLGTSSCGVGSGLPRKGLGLFQPAL